MYPATHWATHRRYPHARAVVLAVYGGLALGVSTVGAGAQPAPRACPGGALENVAVIEVLDAETLRLRDGRIIRLAGVAAPYLTSGGDEADELETQAAAVLDTLRRDGQAAIEPRSDPDRYGRLHADLVMTGADGVAIWVQEELARMGLARIERADLMPDCLGVLAAAENAAIAAGTGLWGTPEHGVRDAGDPSLEGQIGLYEVVRGRVHSVGTRTYMTFVDFGPDYRRDFTIMITPRMVEALAAEGIVAADLGGRVVQVRGVIEASGGPAIRLRRVDEIAVLGE